MIVLNVLITVALIATSVASSVIIQSFRSQIAHNNAINVQQLCQNYSDVNLAVSATPQTQSEIKSTISQDIGVTESEVTSGGDKSR